MHLYSAGYEFPPVPLVYQVFDFSLQHMKKDELEKFVLENAPLLRSKEAERNQTEPKQPLNKAKGPAKKPSPNPIRFSSYTHTEVSDVEIALGLCALLAAFFKSSGMPGTFKLMEWLGFPMPDLEGNEHVFSGWSETIPRQPNRSPQVLNMIPGVDKLEETIQYK